jgi:hypothetical protein
MSTPPKRNVPQPMSGQATKVEVFIPPSLAERTLRKLLIEDLNEEASLKILEEAFKEASCDQSLFEAEIWELDRASRLKAQNEAVEQVLIPSTSLPAVGELVIFDGLTYYIVSHKEAPK